MANGHILDFKWSNECIDFRMMCIFFSSVHTYKLKKNTQSSILRKVSDRKIDKIVCFKYFISKMNIIDLNFSQIRCILPSIFYIFINLMILS